MGYTGYSFSIDIYIRGLYGMGEGRERKIVLYVICIIYIIYITMQAETQGNRGERG